MEAKAKVGHPRKTRISLEWPWVSQETLWMSQEWPWMTWWGKASVGASPRVSWGGEANDRALQCESRFHSKGIQG